MVNKVTTATVIGLKAYKVSVETDVAREPIRYGVNEL